MAVLGLSSPAMEKLESIAFLSLCLGIPVVMGAILVWRLFVWSRDRRVTRRMEREDGWEPVDASTVEGALDGTGIVGGRRLVLSDARRKHGLLVARYRWRSAGGPEELRHGTARLLLLVPRDADTPLGVVQAREGGVLESIALGAVALFTGVEPKELPGWEWAIVGDSGSWLPSAASELVRALLRPAERLHLGRTHAVLSLPDGQMAPLMAEAAERAREVELAIGARAHPAARPEAADHR